MAPKGKECLYLIWATWWNLRTVNATKMSATKDKYCIAYMGVQPQIGTCPSTSTGITSSAATAADFSTPLKGSGWRNEGGTLCLQGKTDSSGLQTVINRYFQGAGCMSPILVSSDLEKALNPSW